MPTRLPGPLARLARNRTRLIALALVAATPLVASTMQVTSALVLQQTLDENWRGGYDLLITARDHDPTTAGLVNPDALVDAATGRLSLADLALIRSLPGVEVAAPVTQVSFSSSSTLSDPLVWVPIPVRADSGLTHPQAFRITVSSTIDDVSGERALAPVTLLAFTYAPQLGEVVIGTVGLVLRTADGQIVYADTTLADRPRLLSADTTVAFTSGNYDADAAAIPLGLYLSPRPAGLVTLVDPVAERQLLGADGAFLDPLVDASAADPDAVPILTLDAPSAPVRLSVAVEEFDSVVQASGADDSTTPLGYQQYGGLAPRLASDTTRPVATFEVDASAALRPFSEAHVVLGELDPTGIADFVANYLAQTGSGPRSVAQARYLVPDDITTVGGGIDLLPRGYVAGSQYVEAPLSRGAPLGSVTEYSKVFNSLTPRLSEEQRGLEDQVEVVGGYTEQQVAALTSAPGYTPLGGYDRTAPTLVLDAEDRPVSSGPLPTSLTGYGIPGTNSMAIGDIRMLDRLDVDRPITSIRIRVDGITDFSAESQQRLLDAVVGLRALGFTATIMAGSSPQTLPVSVTGYAGATVDERGMQVIGDLGTIEQRWARLGAVVEAQTGVSATSIALVALTTASVGAIFAAVQLGSVPGRRATADVLHSQGWRRRRIARWFAGEEVVALAALAILSAAAIALSSTPAVVAASAAVAILLVLVTSVIAVIAGVSPERSRRSSRATVRIRGPVGFGMRRARTNLASTLSLALAMLLLCAIVAVGATILIEGRRAAGPSDLGSLASLRALLPQGALVAIGLAATGLLARLARGMRAERSREQRDVLTASGWSRRARAVAEGAESAIAVVPAAVVGIAASVLIAAELSPASALAVGIASSLAALGAFAVVIVADRRLD